MAPTIETLMYRLQNIKASQKRLEREEVETKKAIVAWLKENGRNDYQSEYCSVRLQSREKKIYNAVYQQQEADLKAAKELLDSLGDYEIVPLEASIVYAAPKTPAVPSF